LLFADGASTGRRGAALTSFACSVADSYGDLIDSYVVRCSDGASGTDALRGITVVGDPQQALQRRYGAGSGCAYLIRPDGYVGFGSARVPLPRFREYLDKVFASGR